MPHTYIHAAPFHFATGWLQTLYTVSLKTVTMIDQSSVMPFITFPATNYVWWAKWWFNRNFWNLFKTCAKPFLTSSAISHFTDFFSVAFQGYFPWEVNILGKKKSNRLEYGFCCEVLLFSPPSRIFRKAL